MTVAADQPVLSDLPTDIPEQHRTIIRPSRGWVSLQLRELWHYRELLFFLAWRDVKVRYKQTALGIAWAVLQPLLGMVVFTVFFGRLAKVPSDGIPYPLFSYSALLAWQLFANSVTESSASVVVNERLITKVYFPRLAIPMSSILAGLVDFAVAFILLIGLMAYYGTHPGWRILMLPLFIMFELATALGVGLWLSALNVQYRDVRYTVPFLVQFWMFASPVVYSSTLVPTRWRPLYGLNPMAGVVEGFRWALLGKQPAPGAMFAVSSLVVTVLLVSGLYYYRRMEKNFADVV